MRAYALQDRGLDTVDANRRLGFADDERDYAQAAAMLRALGVDEVRLLTNNPTKVAGLEAAGIRSPSASPPDAGQSAQRRLSRHQAKEERSPAASSSSRATSSKLWAIARTPSAAQHIGMPIEAVRSSR